MKSTNMILNQVR
jgi:hypothetical protein